jgi:hypothetical protein
VITKHENGELLADSWAHHTFITVHTISHIKTAIKRQGHH